MPNHLGLFLDGTWCMHPCITAYPPEVFYDGGRHSHPGRESLAVSGASPFGGAHIRFVAITTSC